MVVEGMMEGRAAFRGRVLDRARVGLLALSEEAWEAAGGSLEEESGQNTTQ